ncbi:hypothetical protein EO98_18800 [Methanosarcina sp. 2.H.T.1A.6]|uniref:hypothetical protein n=2 Tax=Methanosarcina TaxID=2207 RepID=UPI000621C4B1|nr:hypothetical protein [Methanosarcina sp. 2.H.T.1A.6]KKG17004.1 hypothetical protein EO94_18090 [Methanosarcina sp. 2.H.T.1A.3]KKG20372.1 hypothetical protein EO98_18800 [Methanosarcina sp. 2.H.T.1A.6]KKG23363.1 hypothetical protein EO96_17055 [Methanosarcina sp. 2.H.T.1A.8]KKG27745.1 hypothetical protein EO97_00755 [Methanosarcina sp. 2.H.T.1A.15]
MRQQDAIMRQLAQKVTDFIEPVVPYMVIGSKRAAEEAVNKVGPAVWELKKKLWEKLFSRDRPELKEAAGDLVIAPSDPEVKQVLIRAIINSFEKDPDLAKEISSFMEDELIQRMIVEQRMRTEDGSVKLIKQDSSEKTRVLEEFNKLLEEFTAKNNTVSTAHDLEQLEAESGKEETMEKALDFASKIQYGDLRSQALSLIVPYLKGPEKVKLIEKTLYSTSNIQDEDERARVLSSLVPHLKRQGKEEIIEDILDFSPHIQYGDAKFQILSSLVPHLEESINEVILEKALEMASGIQSDFLRVQSFSLLIPHLKGQRKEEIIEEALELASNLKDKDMRPQALSFIILYLDESRKKEIFEKALEMATGIKSESRRAQALFSLVPYMVGL